MDDQIGHLPKYGQVNLYPTKMLTLTLRQALTGKGHRVFWRRLNRHYRFLFPWLPECTLLFRLYNRHHALLGKFLALALLIGVIDGYCIQLIHLCRERRRAARWGKKGKSNQCRTVGQALLGTAQSGPSRHLSHDTVNVYEGSIYQHLLEQFQDGRVLFSDTGFQ